LGWFTRLKLEFPWLKTQTNALSLLFAEGIHARKKQRHFWKTPLDNLPFI
jgi:hypothetical protein